MKSVSNFFFLLVIVLAVSSCSKEEQGQLVGAQNRPSWSGVNPYGMVYIPSGTLHIGQSDQDVFSTYLQRPKAISISGFFMDDTEITNNEYRQFVEWVRDSIALTKLDETIEDDFGNTRLNWEASADIDYNDETLEDMYIQGDMRIDEKR